MSITKTIGGDRIGSGNKMKVTMNGYERSTHNKGYIFRSTMAPGTLVPFLNEVGLPADTWDIDLDSIIKTLPTVGPLFGSYKAQYDVYMAPIRLYNGLMHNNTLNIGRNISQVKFPQIRLTATANNDGEEITVENINTSQINPSCLLAYIGIRGIGSWDGTGGAPFRDFNALGILMYWDTIKNYYCNKQETNAYVIHTPAEALIQTVDVILVNGNDLDQAPATTVIPVTAGQFINIEYIGTKPLPSQIIFNTSIGDLTGDQIGISWGDLNATTIRAVYNSPAYGFSINVFNWRYISATDVGIGKPALQAFPLTELDHMRNYLLQNLSTVPVIINDADIAPYKYLYQSSNGIPNALSSQEGLAVKCYQSDIYNNWLNSEFIDGASGVNEVSKIDTSDGSFTIDAFVIGMKVWKMLNRIVTGDGTLDTWQEVVYDHRPFSKAETPMYMGGLIKEVIFQEVVSNTETEGQPLGTLAGRGTFASKHKGGKIIIKCDEPCYIQGIVSLTPRIDYSQGNVWDVHLKTLDDLHKPIMDEIGFQDSIVEERAAWDTNWSDTEGAWVQNSAGKIPAWLHYMTNFNRTYGDFAIENNSMFMTLNRRYEANMNAGLVKVKDLTTYIDPSKYNFIFAQTTLDAQNFWMQIAVDITVRRKMSAKLMPNL